MHLMKMCKNASCAALQASTQSQLVLFCCDAFCSRFVFCMLTFRCLFPSFTDLCTCLLWASLFKKLWKKCFCVQWFSFFHKGLDQSLFLLFLEFLLFLVRIKLPTHLRPILPLLTWMASIHRLASIAVESFQLLKMSFAFTNPANSDKSFVFCCVVRFLLLSCKAGLLCLFCARALIITAIVCCCG